MKRGVLFVFTSLLCMISVFSESVTGEFLSKYDSWDRSYNQALARKESSREKSIDRICEDVLKIVCSDKAISIKDEVLKLKSELQRKKTEYSSLIEKSIDAKESSPWPWVQTKEKINREIQKKKNEISDLSLKIVQKKSELQNLFKNEGFDYPISKIDIFCSDSYGNDVLSICVMSNNFNELLIEYREKIVDNNTYASSTYALKYYRIYRLIVETEIYALEESSSNIDSYLTRLEQLEYENDKLITKTIRKIEEKDEYKESYEKNLLNQQMTRTAIIQFREILQKYKNIWAEKEKKLNRQLHLVQNLIETASISSNVSEMIGSVDSLIDAIKGIEVDEILVFDNSDILDQIEELSSKITK